MHKPEESLPLPLVPFSMEECEGIVRVITGYNQMLQTAPLFLQEKETREGRNRRMGVLTRVVDRLGEQLRDNPTAIQLPLNPEEIEEVIKAMMGFVACTKQVIQPSVKRNELLSTIGGWRLCLVGYLSMSYPSPDTLN